MLIQEWIPCVLVFQKRPSLLQPASSFVHPSKLYFSFFSTHTLAMEFPIFSASHSTMMEVHESDPGRDFQWEFERNLVNWEQYCGLLDTGQREYRASDRSDYPLRNGNMEASSESDFEDANHSDLPPKYPNLSERENSNDTWSNFYKIVPQSVVSLSAPFTINLFVPFLQVFNRRSDTSTMGPKTYTWISLWFLITFPVRSNAMTWNESTQLLHR